MACIIAFLRTGSWAAAPERILNSRCPTDWNDSTAIAYRTTNEIHPVAAVRPDISMRQRQPVVIPPALTQEGNPAAFFADGERDLLFLLRAAATSNNPETRQRT